MNNQPSNLNDPRLVGPDLEGVPAVRVLWCSFCNSEEASGELNIEYIGDQEIMCLPIGPDCLARLTAENLHVSIGPSLPVDDQ